MSEPRFFVEAIDELRAAFDDYEACRADLGHEFAAEVAAFVKLISERPLIFGRYRRTEARVCPVQRFPFNVVYLPLDDAIWIVAVAHQRRRPGYWFKRLKKLP